MVDLSRGYLSESISKHPFVEAVHDLSRVADDPSASKLLRCFGIPGVRQESEEMIPCLDYPFLCFCLLC